MKILRNMYLIWRMLWNARIPTPFKFLMPLFAIVYWLSPIDLIPILPFDDWMVMLLAMRYFLQSDTPASNTRTQANFDNAYRNANGYSRSNRNMNDDAYDGKTIETTWHVIDDD